MVLDLNFDATYFLFLISFNRRNFSIKRNFSITHSLLYVNQQFYNAIPSTYVSSKGLPIRLHFTILQLNSSDFNGIISKHIPIDFVYTVFVKVRYNVDQFFMVGNQFGFNYSCESDIIGLLTAVSERLEEYMISYNLTEDAIVYIQITFIQKDKKLLSEFSFPCVTKTDKRNVYHIPKPEIALVETNLLIPVSINKISKSNNIHKVNTNVTPYLNVAKRHYSSWNDNVEFESFIVVLIVRFVLSLISLVRSIISLVRSIISCYKSPMSFLYCIIYSKIKTFITSCFTSSRYYIAFECFCSQLECISYEKGIFFFFGHVSFWYTWFTYTYHKT